MDTGFDKELEKELEDSGWLDSEPVINPQSGTEQKQDIDELFSEIVAQAEASYISSKEAKAEKAAEKKSEPEIQVSKSPNNKIKDIADRIKNAEVLKPEVLKDMFFGSRDAVPLTEPFSDEADNDDEDDEEDQPVLFTKRRRYTADVKKDKLIFETEYMLTPEQAAEGYMLFYNEFVRKKNIKVSLMFGALAALLLISALMLPGSYICYLLIFMCLAVMAIKWLSSMSAKKEALESADSVKNDSYRLSFYNSRIIIKASELSGDTLYSYPPVMIRFEDIDLKVIDFDSIYVLVFKRDYIYTIPKSFLTPEMNKVFTNHLVNILGDDYCEFFTRTRYDRFRLKKKDAAEQISETEDKETPSEEG